MRKSIKQKIVDQIKKTPQIMEITKKHSDLKLEIEDIIRELVESSLGVTNKDINAITNASIEIIEARKNANK